MQGTRTRIGSALREAFPYEPTSGQERVLDGLAEFLGSDPKDRPLFLLKGYAGTGKTTIVQALVRFMESTGRSVVLLAPTGRAAKVMEAYSGKEAHTVHKWIYWTQSEGEGKVRFVLGKNRMKNALFLVDEASMIGASSGFMEGNLLQDLIEFIYSGHGCRAVLIGDDAQLPPVHGKESPALDPEALDREGVSLRSDTLTEVLRQARDSAILANATELRERIRDEDPTPPFFKVPEEGDLHSITGETLHEELEDAYARYGAEEVRIVTRSNKRAVQFSQEVRNRILGKEEELEGGDLLMVVRNDHYWGKRTESEAFIANGDILELVRMEGIEERHGERFADAWVRSSDRPKDGEFMVKLWVDCLVQEAASMPRERMKKLFFNIGEEYQKEGATKWKRKVMQDPTFNALQVKYAYAVTCHKAQGGQWPVIFLEPGFIKPDMIDVEYVRWLYTGMTRATGSLYLVNFPAMFYYAGVKSG